MCRYVRCDTLDGVLLFAPCESERGSERRPDNLPSLNPKRRLDSVQAVLDGRGTGTKGYPPPVIPLDDRLHRKLRLADEQLFRTKCQQRPAYADTLAWKQTGWEQNL